MIKRQAMNAFCVRHAHVPWEAQFFCNASEKFFIGYSQWHVRISASSRRPAAFHCSWLQSLWYQTSALGHVLYCHIAHATFSTVHLCTLVSDFTHRFQQKRDLMLVMYSAQTQSWKLLQHTQSTTQDPSVTKSTTDWQYWRSDTDMHLSAYVCLRQLSMKSTHSQSLHYSPVSLSLLAEC